MKSKRVRGKSGQKKKPFVMLPKDLLEHEDYINLTLKSKVLLVDVLRQYNGYNNGDFCITLSVMRSFGWSSNASLAAAKAELVDAGILILTRQGGRNLCSLYGATFHRIDDCSGKLEVCATVAPPRVFSIRD